MKRLVFCLALCAGLLTVFYGCKKTKPLSMIPSEKQLIREARSWFLGQHLSAAPAASTGNPRTTTLRQPDWSQATVLKTDQNPVIMVPVHYKNDIILGSKLSGAYLYDIETITKLVIYRGPTNAFQGELVTALPDSNFSPEAGNNFSGLIFIDDWDGNPRYRLKSTATSILINNPGIEPNRISADLGIVTCYEIDGYNYSPDDPENGESWSEDAGCTPNFYLGTATSQIGLTAKTYLEIGGGTGGKPPSPAANFTIISGNNPIGNISDYNKCFTNTPGTDHVYQVTVCVDQPIPGTRAPWGFQGGGSMGTGNPIDVGHTFLIFSEKYGGTTITRNIGFYPQGSVNPYYPSSQGQLNDNESSDFNISLTITTDNSQFFNILNFVSQGNNMGFMYNLNGNNCTTFVLRALASGNIILPATVGTWFNGSGNDPGDLGEDIRSMNLSNNMARGGDENPHPNTGNCN